VALRILKSIFTARKDPQTRSRARIEPTYRRPFIAFVSNVDALYRFSPGDTLESPQASMRLRVGIPAQELSRRLPVFLVPLTYIQEDPDFTDLGIPHAIVVGKAPARFFVERADTAAGLVEWVEQMARRYRLFVDFSDDVIAAAEIASHFDVAELQRRLLRACAATVPCEGLRTRLSAEAAHGMHVIEDPYETTQVTPRFSPGEPLRLVWFGVFAAPLKSYLESELCAIARRTGGRAIELAFVTYTEAGPLVKELEDAVRRVNPRFSITHVLWSLEATAVELARADLVLLPQDASSAWGRVKSHNRLVEAIRAGRFAIASPIPSYLELASYAWVGADLAAGIEWALHHPAEVQERLAAGQAYVAERFSPAVIGAKWAELLGVSEAAAA
jgi:glycosyltransferase involved in cell wall biosynthesis